MGYISIVRFKAAQMAVTRPKKRHIPIWWWTVSRLVCWDLILSHISPISGIWLTVPLHRELQWLIGRPCHWTHEKHANHIYIYILRWVSEILPEAQDRFYDFCRSSSVRTRYSLIQHPRIYTLWIGMSGQNLSCRVRNAHGNSSCWSVDVNWWWNMQSKRQASTNTNFPLMKCRSNSGRWNASWWFW